MPSAYALRLKQQTEENLILSKSRRTWKKCYAWFPEAQQAIFSEMNRVYKEGYDKYGEELFKEYARNRHLNKRIYSDQKAEEVKYAIYDKYETLRPYRNEAGRLPFLYYYTKCAHSDVGEQ